MSTLQIIGTDRTELDAIATINAVTDDAHRVNVSNGWWSDREEMESILESHGIDLLPHQAIELLGLVTSEVSEAMEAARTQPVKKWADYETKDTFVRECADAVIRIMDLCRAYNLPLGAAIIEGIKANQARGQKHGGKAA